jgi:hypothetical protein
MKPILVLLIALAVTACPAAAQPETDAGILLGAYTHFALAREVQSQALQMAQSLPQDVAEQIREQADVWMVAETRCLRDNLDARFGNDAKEAFADFVAEYTTAESQNDQHYLGKLATEARLGETPMEFAAMRRLVMDKWLAAPFENGSRLLGEIQTWVERRDATASPLTLAAWLSRNQAHAPTPPPAAAPPPRPVNPLAAAEAPLPDFTPMPEGASSNPMEAFARSRQDKRERALQEAQAGMQQMAMERQAVEQEYAARKSADAQADAEAMRAQAQKLAAVEQEAVDQRANSWMGRLKNIVSATVGAATGAFTGGIGAEAGRQAADALFK